MGPLPHPAATKGRATSVEPATEGRATSVEPATVGRPSVAGFGRATSMEAGTGEWFYLGTVRAIDASSHERSVVFDDGT